MSQYQQEDYQRFLAEDSHQLSKEQLQRVEQRLGAELLPSFLHLLKLALPLHILTGLFSLAVCHQFGMNPFSTRFSIDHLFMQWWGHQLCFFACGFFFFGVTQWVLWLLFSPMEWRRWNQFFSLSTALLIVASVLVLQIASRDFDLQLALLWSLGAWAAHQIFMIFPRWMRTGY